MIGRLGVALAIGSMFVTVAFLTLARGQESPPQIKIDPRVLCPTPAPCKILILTPEEEQALLAPKMVLETAEQGRPLDLLGIIKYFRDKIAKAPLGASLAPPAEKE